MPACAVCKNYDGSAKCSGISFHRFPKNDDSKLHKWLIAVKSHLKPSWTIDKIRQYCTKPSGVWLCSDHFAPDCCYDNLKASLLSYDKKRHPAKLLTDDAIPTIFGKPRDRESSDCQRKKRANKQLIQELLLQPTTTTTTTTIQPTTTTTTTTIQPKALEHVNQPHSKPSYFNSNMELERRQDMVMSKPTSHPLSQRELYDRIMRRQRPRCSTGTERYDDPTSGPSRTLTIVYTRPSSALASQHTGPSCTPTTQHTGPSCTPTTQHTGPSCTPTTQHTGPSSTPTTQHTGPSSTPTTQHTGPSFSLTTPHTGPSCTPTTQQTGPSFSLTTPHTGPSCTPTTQQTGPSFSLTTPHTGPSSTPTTQHTGPSSTPTTQEHTGPSCTPTTKTNTSCPESRPKKKNFSTGKYCKAYGCKSANYIQVDGKKTLSNVSFFSVPKKVLDNKKKLKHWASLMKRDISALNQGSVVCEKHFEDSDILRWSGHGLRLKTPKLREGALPVLHSWVTVKPKRPAPKQRCWPPPKKLKGPKSKKIAASENSSPVDNSANGTAPDHYTTMDASGPGLDNELDDHHNYAIRLGHDSRLEGDNAPMNSVVTPKFACLSNSVRGGGKDLQSDHISEGDRNPPMTGILGFSKETTLALLPRMKVEELQSELNRRNIVVAAGYRARRRGDLEHVLREVMTKEYEAEEDEGMDMSNTSSTFEHGCSNTSPTFEHGCSNSSSMLEQGCSNTSLAFEHDHWLEMGDGSQVPSAPNNDQTTLQNVRELSQEHTEKEETSSWQATDMDVSETPSTDTSLEQIQVKKEPMELLEFEQYTYSAVGVTEPSTSPTQHLGTVLESQPNSVSSQDPMVRIKTEPGVEEKTEVEQQNLRSEPCPSSLGQLLQEQVKVEVSTEEDDKPSSSSKEPEKAVHVMLTRPIKCRVPAWSSDEIRALLKFLSLPSEGWDPTQSTGWPKMRSQHPLWSKAAQFVQENSRSSILRTVGAVQTQVSKHLNSLYPLSAGGRLAAEKAMRISEQESHTESRPVFREDLSPEPTRRYMDAGAQTEERFLKPHVPVLQETSAPVPQGISIPDHNEC